MFRIVLLQRLWFFYKLFPSVLPLNFYAFFALLVFFELGLILIMVWEFKFIVCCYRYGDKDKRLEQGEAELNILCKAYEDRHVRYKLWCLMFKTKYYKTEVRLKLVLLC